MNTENLGHLMVDIETFGSKSHSVICSLAAVEFDIATGQTGKTFKENIDVQSCLELGLKIDGSTLEWWLNQSNEARTGLLTCKMPLPLVINRFWSFFKNLCNDEMKVWGNGARFDLGILENATTACGMLIPWKHWNERDVRTLVSFAPEIKKEMPFEGVKHDAIADCMHQIKYCSAIYQQIIGLNRKEL
jgi:hypothetical protein